MAKGRFKKTRGVIGRAFDVRKWGNAEGWWGYALHLVDTIQKLFIPSAPTKKETLAIVMRRLKLTEEQVIKKQKQFFYLALFTFVLTLGALTHLLYMLSEGHFKALPLGVAVTVIAAAFTFRYHFWYFQIKQGKLGCTVQEWLKGTFGWGK